MRDWTLLFMWTLVVLGLALVLSAVVGCASSPIGSPPQRFKPAIVVRDAFGCPPGWTCLRNQDADSLGFYLQDLERFAERCKEAK